MNACDYNVRTAERKLVVIAQAKQCPKVLLVDSAEAKSNDSYILVYYVYVTVAFCVQHPLATVR